MGSSELSLLKIASLDNAVPSWGALASADISCVGTHSHLDPLLTTPLV